MNQLTGFLGIELILPTYHAEAYTTMGLLPNPRRTIPPGSVSPGWSLFMPSALIGADQIVVYTTIE